MSKRQVGYVPVKASVKVSRCVGSDPSSAPVCRLLRKQQRANRRQGGHTGQHSCWRTKHGLQLPHWAWASSKPAAAHGPGLCWHPPPPISAAGRGQGGVGGRSGECAPPTGMRLPGLTPRQPLIGCPHGSPRPLISHPTAAPEVCIYSSRVPQHNASLACQAGRRHGAVQRRRLLRQLVSAGLAGLQEPHRFQGGIGGQAITAACQHLLPVTLQGGQNCTCQCSVSYREGYTQPEGRQQGVTRVPPRAAPVPSVP